MTIATLALVGSGNIGSTLARLAVGAGLDVVLANSRGPETLADLVDELGPRARAATAAEAAAAGDAVVVTIPLRAVGDLATEPFAGKVVLDTVNYYPDRDGHVVELDDESTTTSELVQRHLDGARVVKAFNNIYFEHLRSLSRVSGDAERTTLPIAGDDDAAKVEAVELIDRLGYDALDAGPLAEGWRFQRDLPAYAGIYAADGDFAHPRVVGRDELSEALGRARRYRDL
ncbi:NADPH-dependent F420 reductase [Nocardioides marmoraquaticus]